MPSTIVDARTLVRAETATAFDQGEAVRQACLTCLGGLHRVPRTPVILEAVAEVSTTSTITHRGSPYGIASCHYNAHPRTGFRAR